MKQWIDNWKIINTLLILDKINCSKWQWFDKII